MNKTTQNSDAKIAFLNAAGWSGAKLTPLAGDASTRSYVRVEKDERKALLMIAPPGAEDPACPPDASDDERRNLGYNAMARLAGPNLYAFTAIANTLREAGLSAPEIFAADAEIGLALIEDLGDNLFARVLPAPNEQTLYENAVDVLLCLRSAAPSPPATSNYVMLSYDMLALASEMELLIEWYWPLKKGAKAPDHLWTEYYDLCKSFLEPLSQPHSIVLRDYHAENLLWLPDREDAARTGLIDFQDGLYGHAAYDLVSLLEDARRDVPDDLTQAMLSHYCANASGLDHDLFLNDYAILAAQRNAKILGVFARLAERDKKPRYLDFMPRVEAHFRKDLARPAAAPLRDFIAQHFPDLAS